MLLLARRQICGNESEFVATVAELRQTSGILRAKSLIIIWLLKLMFVVYH